jgi:hypothetical protein
MLFGFAQLLVLFIAGLFWIFVLWMFWKIVQGLRGIDQGIKEIAGILRDKP